jgi:hypothetical protein
MAHTISDRIIPTIPVGGIHIMEWHHIFPQFTGRRRKSITLAKAEWHKLQHDTNFEGINFKAGSLFKFWETQNFGWVCFHPNSLTPDGNKPGKYLFRY